MKIAFIHDWPVHYLQELTWKDGLSRAVKELKKEHELQFYVEGEYNDTLRHDYFPINVSNNIKRDVSEYDPDVIIFWADATRPNIPKLAELGKPMALCFSGGEPRNQPHWKYFEHIFVENEVYKHKFQQLGKSVSVAFGTNTELFKPFPEQEKVFDAIFPATFCDWKRHNLFAEATNGIPACAVGHIYESGQEYYCQEYCLKAGNLVLPHVSAETLHRLYAASRTVVVTSSAIGGSQRTVLEAMAMNIPVIVMADSDKTTEYVIDSRQGVIVQPRVEDIRAAIEDLKSRPHITVNTREYVERKWSHVTYADELNKWILKYA